MDRRLLAQVALVLGALSAGVAAAITMTSEVPDACAAARAYQTSHQPVADRLVDGGTVVFDTTPRAITKAERVAIRCYVQHLQTKD